MGKVVAYNQPLANTGSAASTHGFHFTGTEDHISGHSVVYASRYTPDPGSSSQGTTEIVAYDFGSSTVTPTPYTLESTYGCGNTEQGELQISPDGNTLA